MTLRRERECVEAYANYIHYVERLNQTTQERIEELWNVMTSKREEDQRIETEANNRSSTHGSTPRSRPLP